MYGVVVPAPRSILRVVSLRVSRMSVANGSPLYQTSLKNVKTDELSFTNMGASFPEVVV